MPRPTPDAADLRAAFEAAHEERYGYRDPDGESSSSTSAPAPVTTAPTASRRGARRGRRTPRRVRFDASGRRPRSLRGEPRRRHAIDGPGGLRAARGRRCSSRRAGRRRVDDAGTTPILRARDDRPGRAPGPDGAPARGLRGDGRGARSARPTRPNIKERRDASTALFDAGGEMVMQAEHIPVHLGAMPAAVAAVLRRGPRARPGSWILNDPYRGGTHLPDITVITPVFAAGELLGFAATRAHHADVGGRRRARCPPTAATLADEGVVIAPRVLDEDAIGELVAQMRQPAPAPRRPPRPARRQPDRRAAAARARRAASAPRAARALAEVWTTPSGARAPASPRSRRRRTRRTCSRRARATADPRCGRPSTASA